MFDLKYPVQHNYLGHEYFCVNCKNILSVGYKVTYMNYCDNCGSGLDWTAIKRNKNGGREYNAKK